MSLLSALIVDDEPKACNVLQSLVNEYCDEISEIQTCTNPDEAIDIIQSNSPDILFLDINMPQKSGFDMLDELGHFDGKLVFTTAYHEHAIKAFKYSAFDYLLKPIKIDDLVNTVQRVSREQNEQSQNGDLQKLFEQFARRSSFPSSIAIHDKGGMLFLDPATIIYLEGQGNYTKIQCTDKHFVATKSIKSFEDTLDPDVFLRVHKSYIVNIQHVTRFMPQDGGELTLTNDHVVYVSRRKRHLLEKYTI